MNAVQLDYSAARAEIRQDLRDAHRSLLEYLRRPGSCFTGAQRVAIAAEARRAPDCALCRERRRALSPEHARGRHESRGELGDVVVDVVHRVRTDPGRLSRRWYDGVRASGLGDGEYVEAVGIAAFTAGIDALCRALGIAAFPLPEPLPGEPSGHRPGRLTEGIAWVPLLLPEDASGPDADVYAGAEFVPNVMRALSLVPDHVRALRELSAAHYVDVRDLAARRALDRPQIELVAARVSALNQCFY